MLPEYANRAMAVFDRRLVDARRRKLPHIALGRAQREIPLLDDSGRRQALMAGFRADEFRDVFKALAHHVLGAARDDRQIAHAELKQAVAAAGRVDYVNRFEIDAFTRK